MSTQCKIYLAVHRGRVGAVILRTPQHQGQTHLATRTHASPHIEDGEQQLVWVSRGLHKGELHD